MLSRMISLAALPIYVALAAPPNFCKDVNIIVELLKLQKATPFCSSFISLPAVTKTATVTAATAVVTVSTATDHAVQQITATSYGTSVLLKPVTNTQTITSTVFSTSTATVFVTSPVDGVTTVTLASTVVTAPASTVTNYAAYVYNKKRDDADVEKRAAGLPPFLSKFLGPEISKACSCLDIPLATTTTTAGITATSGVVAKATVTSIVTAVQTVIETTTSVVVVSATTETTASLTALATTIVTAYSTSLSTATAYSTTITTTPIATATVTFDPCDPANAHFYRDEAVYDFGNILHSGYINGPRIDNSNPSACCKACYGTPGCVVHFLVSNTCYVTLAGTVGFAPSISKQCPNGFDFRTKVNGRGNGLAYSYSDGPNYNFGLGPCFAGETFA